MSQAEQTYQAIIDKLKIKNRKQADRIAELEKQMWMTEVNVQQQTLKHIINLLTLQHDTLACTSYPMKRKEK
jgi:hypothetical protein